MNNFKKFQAFVAKKGFTSFTFLSENQPFYSAVAPCKPQLTFTNILIGDYPRIVFLTNGENHMLFSRIKDVKFKENATAVGSLIQLTCAGPDREHSTVQYSLLAS